MNSRLVPALLIAGAIAYACSPRTHGAEPARGNAASGPAVASSLNVKVNDGVAFAFHVTNHASRRLELTFPSGQTHDIAVLDSLGRVVWKWSDGRLFTQSFQNKVLEANQTLTYQASWTPPPTGKFTAVASLKSENHPLEQRVAFSLP
jgi:hypothetical protein